MEKPYNGNCPSCGCKKAYANFISYQCPNVLCENYDQAQYDLVCNYELYLEKIQKEEERERQQIQEQAYDLEGFYSKINPNCVADDMDDTYNDEVLADTIPLWRLNFQQP